MSKRFRMVTVAAAVFLLVNLIAGIQLFTVSAADAQWTLNTGATSAPDTDGAVKIDNAHKGAQIVLPGTRELYFSVKLPAAVPNGEWGRLMIGTTAMTGTASAQTANAVGITFGNLDESPVTIKVGDAWSGLSNVMNFSANTEYRFRLRIEENKLVMYINEQKVLTSDKAPLIDMLNGSGSIHAAFVGGGTKPVSYIVNMNYGKWRSGNGAVVTEKPDGVTTLGFAQGQSAQALLPGAKEMYFSVKLSAMTQWARLMVGPQAMNDPSTAQSVPAAATIVLVNNELRVGDAWNGPTLKATLTLNTEYRVRLRVEAGQLAVYLNDTKVFTSAKSALADMLDGNRPIYAAYFSDGQTADVNMQVRKDITLDSGTASSLLSLGVTQAIPGTTVYVTAKDGARLKEGMIRYSVDNGASWRPLYIRDGSSVYLGGEQENDNTTKYCLNMPDADILVKASEVSPYFPSADDAAKNNLTIFGVSYRKPTVTNPKPGLQFGARIQRNIKIGTEQSNIEYTLRSCGIYLISNDLIKNESKPDGMSWKAWLTSLDNAQDQWKDVPATNLLDRCTGHVDYAARITYAENSDKKDKNYVAVAYGKYKADGQTDLVLESQLSKAASYNSAINIDAP